MSEHHGDGLTRRDVLIGAAGGLALAARDPRRADAQASPASQVSGIVFEDRDGSGASSAANPGLAGVLVSNGRDVAITGLDGRYTLHLPEEATIFVIKPAGFMPPIEPLTNLPRFYRHHQPQGSPAELNLRFEGLPPTGPLANIGGFPASSSGRAKNFQPRDGDRSAAGDRRGSRLHSRGSDPGFGRPRRELRPHRGRRHVRRPLALSTFERDHGRDWAAVVEYRRQSRSQSRGP